MAVARARILDAAQRLAIEGGAGHLTIDAIASAAGVSKGGLLYHFPTKEALIAAVAEDYAAGLGGLVEQALTGMDSCTGLGGELEAHITGLLSAEGCSRSLGAALLVAAANDISSLGVIRRRFEEQTRWLAESPDDFAQAAVILLALDGLMLREALQLSAFTVAERARVVDELLRRARSLGYPR